MSRTSRRSEQRGSLLDSSPGAADPASRFDRREPERPEAGALNIVTLIGVESWC